MLSSGYHPEILSEKPCAQFSRSCRHLNTQLFAQTNAKYTLQCSQSSPYHLWGPHSLLFYGYLCSILEGKAFRAWSWPLSSI